MKFFEANTYGVRNLVEICNELQNLKKVLFTSSLLVCANGYVPKDEFEYCPPNLYGESKAIGERYVRELAKNFSWVIVRPTSIWGPWFEHSYLTFFRVLDSGFYVHPGNVPIVKPISYVGNTVYMMKKILCDNSAETNGKTYYLADYPDVSIQHWANIISDKLGRKYRPRVAPIILLKIIAKCGDLLKLVGYGSPPLTSFRLKNMLTGIHYPIEKTESVVGKLPYDLARGVGITLAWMKNQKLIKD